VRGAHIRVILRAPNGRRSKAAYYGALAQNRRNSPLVNCSKNYFLLPMGGHSGAPRGAKLGSSYNRFVHTYCGAIVVSSVQWGESNA
jgi:hypothetical protein